MNSYKVSKFVVGLAGICVSVLLYVSLAPIAFGGLDVKMDDDPKVEYDDTENAFKVNGNISIASSMPWDISLGYEVILGTVDKPFYSFSDCAEIKSGETGNVPVKVNAGVDALILYFLSCMNSGFQSDTIGGVFSGQLSLPLTVLIDGDYIQKIVQFSVCVGFDMGGDIIMGSLTKDAGETTLDGELKFKPASSITFPNLTIAFSIESNEIPAKTLSGTMSCTNNADGSQSVIYNISSGSQILDVLASLQIHGGIMKVGAFESELGPGQIGMLADSIVGMLGMAVVL